MRKFLIILLFLGGTCIAAIAQQHNNRFTFPGTNLKSLAVLSQQQRDSLLTAFSKFDATKIELNGVELSQSLQKQFRSVLTDMMEVVKNVIKDPSTLGDMEKKMASLTGKMNTLNEKVSREMELKDLEEEYNRSCEERKKDFEGRTYNSPREKKTARRELAQELRDLKRDYEDDRARLRRGEEG